MEKSIKLTIIFALTAVSLIAGCTNAKCFSLKKTTHFTTVYFNRGVYKADSPDYKNSYKNYFYVFYDEMSGHTEEKKIGIGLPFSCIQKNGYVKFKFGGESEPEEIFKIKSVEDKVISGHFKDGSMLIFTPVLDANPDNFDAVEYTTKNNPVKTLHP